MANSPLCEVRDGAGPWQSTNDGVNVTPGNVISVRPVSIDGIDVWDLDLVGSDDMTSPGDIVVSNDPVAKVATFTMPATLARSLIFRSRVNRGINGQRVKDDTLTTMIGIYTLTEGGLRVIAANETNEGNLVYGYIEAINALIRDPSGGIATGPQGPAGPTGPAGPAGEQGEQGEPGVALAGGPDRSVQFHDPVGDSLSGASNVGITDDGTLFFGDHASISQTGAVRTALNPGAEGLTSWDVTIPSLDGGGLDQGIIGADNFGRVMLGVSNSSDMTPANNSKVAYETYATARSFFAATLIDPDLIIPGTGGPFTHYPAIRLIATADPTATGDYAGKQLVMASISPHMNFVIQAGRNHHPTADEMGRGRGVFFFGNANRNPSTNPALGIILYVDSADNLLKYRKTDGTVITVAGANPAGTGREVQFRAGPYALGASGNITATSDGWLAVGGAAGDLPSYGSLRVSNRRTELGSAGAFELTMRSAEGPTGAPVARDVTLISSFTNSSGSGWFEVLALGDKFGNAARNPYYVNVHSQYGGTWFMSGTAATPLWGGRETFGLYATPGAGPMPDQTYRRMVLVYPNNNFVVFTDEVTPLATEDMLGTGEGVFYLGHAKANPSTNPAGGVIIYADGSDGHLKYRKPSGDVVTITGLPGGATDTDVMTWSAGSPTWSKIANANVANAAAIAGTKISPNFGSQHIVTSGQINQGANAATTGFYNVPQGWTLKGRNLANDDDRMLMEWTSVGGNEGLFISSYDVGAVSINAGAGAYLVTPNSDISVEDANGIAFSTGATLRWRMNPSDAGLVGLANSYVSIANASGVGAGHVRVPYGSTGTVILGSEDAGGTDRALISNVSTNIIRFGSTALATELRGTQTDIHGSNRTGIYTTSGSGFALLVDSTNIRTSLPVAGSQFESKPFRLKRKVITGGSSVTLLPEDYECVIIQVNSTGDGQTVILPLEDGAFFIAKNGGSGANLLFKGATGTGVTVDGGHSKIIWSDGTNYYPAVNEAGA